MKREASRSVLIEADLHKRLKLAAFQHGELVTDLADKFIREGLDRLDDEAGENE